MPHASLNAFLADFEAESGRSAALLDRVSDASLEVRIAPRDRSLRELAWHIVATLVEMPAHAGLQVPGPGPQDPAPATARAIAEAYRANAAALVQTLREQWTDAQLVECFDIYGMQWSGAQVLEILLRHEIHHRAQLVVLLRQAGLQPPEIYGPVRRADA